MRWITGGKRRCTPAASITIWLAAAQQAKLIRFIGKAAAKLLRALQERTIDRIGGKQPLRIEIYF